MTQKGFKRKLTAILSADVEGYSRLMGEDEEATVRTLTSFRTAFADLVQQFRGRVVDSPGDNILAEFTSVVDAVNCSVEIQRELAERNAELPYNRRMEFRIGVNLGDVIEEQGRIYGDGVNIAARVESLAEAGGVCISGRAYDQVANKLGLEYENLGEHQVKNISTPIRVYRVLSFPGAAAHRVVQAKETLGRTWRRRAVAIAAVIGFLIVIGGVWQYYLRRPSVEPASVKKMAYPLPDKPSIAVLPFVNMSADPEQDYFSDGITEEIITGLSKVPRLFVIARNSTFTYKGKPVKVQQVAEELGVQYVLEGSVRKAKGRVRITAQLVDATTGKHLWAEKYDRALKDIFALQDEIMMKVIAALQVKLTEGEQALIVAGGTNNFEAYAKFLQGVEYAKRFNRDGNLLARKMAQETIALDPNYPRGYRLLATSHWLDVRLGISTSPKQSLAKAAELYQKVIALDPSDAVAHGFLGMVYTLMRQHEKGIAEAEKAVAINPNAADAQCFFGLILHFNGRHNEAIEAITKAIRLNPFPPNWYFMQLGFAYCHAGRYEEAIEALKKALRVSPDNLPAHTRLAATYSLSGREEEARAEAAEVLKINPKFSLQYFAKTLPYKNKADIERYISALRKAGLPDKPPLPLPDKPSIAVLPFLNMSDDPKQEYFSDGITEEIITALSKTSKLFVIARTSSFKYKGKEIDVRTVGRELGVRYLLEGSVRRFEGSVRITAQLVEARTGNHVWAHRYDRDLKDIFALQDELTMKILTALQVKLTEGEQARIWGKRVKRIDVYLKLLEARSLWAEGTKASHIRFGQVAQDVIDMAPELETGYILMAWHQWWLSMMGKSPRESMLKAFNLAKKSLDLYESSSHAHALLGQVYLLMRKYEKAITAGERSVELDPNGAMVRGLLGMTLSYADRPDEAIAQLNHAIRLNPFAPYWYFLRLGQSYTLKGEYEEALKAYKKALQRAPEALATHAHLTALYVLLDRQEEAVAAVKKLLEIDPDFSVERTAKTLPFKNQAHLKLVVDAMRKAGLK